MSDRLCHNLIVGAPDGCVVEFDWLGMAHMDAAHECWSDGADELWAHDNRPALTIQN